MPASDPRPATAHLDEIEDGGLEHGARYAARWKSLTNAISLYQIGARLVSVPPGKTAWPFHRHLANEELCIIVSGEGEARIGEERIPVRAGHATAHPERGPAHQLINTGREPLVYWCISTMIDPDTFEYPDSGKWGVIGGDAPPGRLGPREISVWFYPDKAGVDYYDAED
ncbi:MAG: cupin domain-containing protein [Maricaulaceae bacterium]